MNTIENPPAMTAEQIAKLVAQCREFDEKWGNPNASMSESWAAEHNLALLAPQLCNALEAAQKENAELRMLVGELVERREDAMGFYYVSKHMGGLGSPLSHQIEAALARVSRKGGAL